MHWKFIHKLNVLVKSNILVAYIHASLTAEGILKDFDVFLTVHHSIDFFQVTNLMHTSFIL